MMTINQPTWLKRSLVGGSIVLGCWAGAIWYWRTSTHEPATNELVLLLLALPALIVAACWFGSRLLSRAAAPLAATPPTLGQPTNAARLPTLKVLAASASLPHGATLDEFAAAIANGDVRTELDAELVLNKDTQIEAARSDEAVDDALQEEIVQWFSSVGITVELHDEQWRALILGTAVVREISAHARSLLKFQQTTRPTIKLVPLLPAEWEESERDAAAQWLGQAFLQSGWPADQFEIADVFTHITEMDPSTTFGRLSDASAFQATAVIVMACASHIGQHTVDKWASRLTLFTPTNPDGDVPGEGAAGLLLTTLPAAAVATLPMTSLHPGKRTARVAPKRGDPSWSQMEEITEVLLNDAQVRADDIAKVVADTSSHSKRVFELMNFASTSMKHLDVSVDVTRVGAISGACDYVSVMAALGLAHHYALEDKGPVLVISNTDPDYLWASVVNTAGDHAPVLDPVPEATGKEATVILA
jgi:hypothetical protein